MSEKNKDNLELEVTDFGPIVRAKLELRPLTVFIGPSNTGKSYLAILIYALHRYFSGIGLAGHRRYSRPTFMYRNFVKGNLSEKTKIEMRNLAAQIVADTENLNIDDGISIPGPVLDFIRSGFAVPSVELGNEISRCFGIESPEMLLRKGANDDAIINARKLDDKNLNSVNHCLKLNSNVNQFNTDIPKNAKMWLLKGNDDYFAGRLRDLAMENMSPRVQDEEGQIFAVRFIGALIDHMRPQIFGDFNSAAFYLPADRTGVMHAHSVVVSALIESAAMAGLRPAARTPMLSGVLADFLEQLIVLDRPLLGRRMSKNDLGAPIEKDILGGSIGVKRSEATDYPHFTYRPEGWKEGLSLMNASSMVSELAPVVLYLRHLVKPGDLIIVEEPESHLHPAMQVQFTRQIAAVVKQGIRVIVTTHSEWVLEELANIVQRSSLSDRKQKIDSEPKIALNPNQVGAWLFKQAKRPKGSKVQEVKLDDKIGLYPTDFDNVSEELYNESARIFSRIQNESEK